MTETVLMTDPDTGAVGLYDENGSSGAFDDPNSTRNLPLNNPVTYIDHIRGPHSGLDHLQVAYSGSTTISYSSVAGAGTGSGFSVGYGTEASPTDDLLLSFGTTLSEEPWGVVAVGSNALGPGMPVQTTADGGARYATIYATTTELRVATICTLGATGLSSVSVPYPYLVFAAPPAASGSKLVDWDPGTGIFQMGLGKFHTDAAYLQVVPGGSPLRLLGDRNIDLDNGAPRYWLPDGTTYDTVPSTQKVELLNLSQFGADLGGETYGNSMAYGGSYAGPAAATLVQAP